VASLNPLTRELVLKLVFYGPGLGGKTTTLEYIHASTKAENRGQMISLATMTDRTLYFDFLPLRVPRVRGMNVRLQLFTVPGQVYYAATRRLVLSGADGIVFVADSQSGRMEANLESLEDLNANLGGHGKALVRMPHTFHWNKRDLSDLVPMEVLDRSLNKHHAPALGTCATRGDGVFEGLERITRLALQHYEADLPKSEQNVPSLGSEGAPGSIADAIRAHTEAPIVSDGTSAAEQRRGLQQKVTPFPGTTAPKPERASVPPVTRSSGTVPAVSRSTAPSFGVREVASVRALAVEGAPVFSLAELWPESEREAVRQAEGFLAAGDANAAILACETLLARVLASAGELAGVSDAPRDPGVVALFLRLDGRRYIAFRASVRAARESGKASMRDALESFAFVLEASAARDALER
jgi:signal recognition particle receptor subunit beta